MGMEKEDKEAYATEVPLDKKYTDTQFDKQQDRTFQSPNTSSLLTDPGCSLGFLCHLKLL